MAIPAHLATQFLTGLTALSAEKAKRQGTKFTLRDLIIANKQREMLSLGENLNAPQKAILSAKKPGGTSLEEGLNATTSEVAGLNSQRHIILKPRQIGSSTLFTGIYFLDSITVPNTNTLILAHEKQTAANLLDKCRTFHKFLGELAPQKGIDNFEMISFPELNSTIKIATAMNGDSGRGFTYHNFLGTEVAFWPNAAQILKGVFESVPLSGNVTLESTANGEGDVFHRMIVDALANKSEYLAHFYPWFMMEEYKDFEGAKKLLELGGFEALRGKFDSVFGDEKQICSTFNLSLEQMAFRRLKIASTPASLKPLLSFQQEYPATAAEAFVGSGQGYFDADSLGKMKLNSCASKFGRNRIPPQFSKLLNLIAQDEIEIFELPKVGGNYLVVNDPSEGINKDENHDFSSFMVFDLSSWEVILRVSSRRVSPLESSQILVDLGNWYNLAVVMVERNNHGHAVLQGLTLIDPLTNSPLYPLERVYHHTDFETAKIAKSRGAARTARKNAEVRQLGFPSSVKTKKLSLDCLDLLIKDQSLIIRSAETFLQLSDYRKFAGGTSGASSGNHDDDVSCLRMLAYYVTYENVVKQEKEKVARVSLSRPIKVRPGVVGGFQ